MYLSRLRDVSISDLEGAEYEEDDDIESSASFNPGARRMTLKSNSITSTNSLSWEGGPRRLNSLRGSAQTADFADMAVPDVMDQDSSPQLFLASARIADDGPLVGSAARSLRRGGAGAHGAGAICK
mmetsp:Transcript_69037/g.213500  ORF Transcript_69037/g.213500 Transcript_69037/m.213500 type:complete len:126 (-) Transcript_69037:6-383(-)